MGNSFGNWFGGDGLFGESDRTLAEDMEMLADTNRDLRRSIEMLSRDMREASTAEALEVYAKQRSDLEDLINKTRNVMERAGAGYNNGFLGIGGKGSSNKRINSEMSAEDWNKVSRAAGKSVRSASDFWRLSSEEMANVAKNAQAQWTTIRRMADEGYADASQYMEEYIGYYEELEALQDAINEKLTATTWDSVADEFKSMLLDMTSDAEDFTDNFENLMQQAVINSLMDSVFNERIKSWYGEFSRMMEEDNGRLSLNHQELLRTQYKVIAEDAIAARDAIADMLDWDTSLSQQGANKSLSGMSQSTGDAIEGRLTAIYAAEMDIHAARQSESISLANINDTMLRLLEQSMERSTYYNELLTCANRCYLELAGIQQNTGAVVGPIKEMAENIADMQRKIKYL